MANSFGVDLAQQLADSVRDAIKGYLARHNVNFGLGTNTVINAISALVFFLSAVPFIFFNTLFLGAATIAGVFLSGFDDARKENQPAINRVIAGALSEVLSIDISADDLPAGGDAAAQIQRAIAIGGKLTDLLESTFGGTPDASSNQAAKAARAFAGFSINAAVGSALIGIIAEIESLGFFKQFHELGDDVIQSLGLGRMMRRVWGPMFDALIIKPYTLYLNAKYTPNHLTAGEVMTAFNSGRLDESTMTGYMAQLGYSAAYIAELRMQHVPKLSEREVDALIRWGDLPADRGLEVLIGQGLPSGVAANKLMALEREESDAAVKAYLGELFTLAKDRYITSDTFLSLLDRQPLHESTKQVWRNRIGLWLDSPHKRLSIGEIIYLLERHQLTDEYIDTWATNEGYSQDDVFMLQAYSDIKALEYEDAQKKKAAAAAAKAAKAAAKGQPPAPPPPPPPGG